MLDLRVLFQIRCEGACLQPVQASLAESFSITSGVVLARAKCRFKRGRAVRELPVPLEQALADERRIALFSSIIVVGI